MIGDIIKAGTSLAAGYMQGEAQKDANAANLAAQQNNLKMQKKFAQEGIRMRVEDAKAAGIHPLYALGASTPSYTPQSSAFTPESGLATGLAAAGQDVGRAFNATRTAPERQDAYTEALRGLHIKNAELDVEIKKTDLASKVARLGQQTNPAMASASDDEKVLDIGKYDDVTPVVGNKRPLAIDRGWSDGQTFEDRWGEWGGGAAGLAVMIADLINHARQRTTIKRVPNDGSWLPKFEWR